MSVSEYVPLIQTYFPASEWGMGECVMEAESHGNPNAHATVGEDSRGLMQINVAEGANPQYAVLNLYDPDTNVRVAAEMWGRSGWGPWSTAPACRGVAASPALSGIDRIIPNIGQIGGVDARLVVVGLLVLVALAES